LLLVCREVWSAGGQQTALDATGPVREGHTMTTPTAAVLFAGAHSALSATLEAAFVRDGIDVHHVGDASTLDPSAASNVPRAVVFIVPPALDGGGLRDYKRRVSAELDGLVGAMPERAQIVIVVDVRGRDAGAPTPALKIETAMSRLRAMAAQERGSDVTVNAVLLRGGLDDGTVAQRIWETMRSGTFPDTGFTVTDADIRHQSITSAIAEQCS
jgi:hypothetical protein